MTAEQERAAVVACKACGGTERLQKSHGAGGLNDVCLPCFYIWYDGISYCRRDECASKLPHVHPEDIGELSRKLKAEGSYPWNKPARGEHLLGSKTDD